MNSVHCELKEGETTTGVIGYVQIYPGGTERSAERNGGVARPFVRVQGERNVMFVVEETKI